MTTIKASCPTCGEVDLTSPDVTLMVCSQRADLSYYAFTCPTCKHEIHKPAPWNVISLLRSGGVEPTTWSIPAEVLEPKTGPALTYDDLLDFCLDLENIRVPDTGIDSG